MCANKPAIEKKMCKHKHLVFLGKQQIPSEDRYLALFNCMDCRSTISLRMLKRSVKRRKVS